MSVPPRLFSKDADTDFIAGPLLGRIDFAVGKGGWLSGHLLDDACALGGVGVGAW